MLPCASSPPPEWLNPRVCRVRSESILLRVMLRCSVGRGKLWPNMAAEVDGPASLASPRMVELVAGMAEARPSEGERTRGGGGGRVRGVMADVFVERWARGGGVSGVGGWNAEEE